MRIGFLTSDLTHRHGWGHYSLSLIDALRRAGVEVVVAASRNTRPDASRPAAAFLPDVDPRDGRLLLRLLFAARHARGLLRGCDVIHVTVEHFAPLGLWAAGHRPLFVTGHGSYVRLPVERGWPVGALYRRAFQRAHMVCVSGYTARALRDAVPEARVAVVNNGVDVERFAHLPPPGTPKRGPTVLSVGAVKARKGTLELVRAMAAVRRAVPDAQCVILGSLEQDLEYATRVRAAIRDLALDDCVHLMGYVPDETLLAWYGAADVFALPSLNAGWKFEGYGLAHIEAAAAGLPAVGTRECGAEDAIDDGVTGLLVAQARIAEELPRALIALLADDDRRARMGAVGRQKARAQTWDHVARQMIGLYEDALAP